LAQFHSAKLVVMPRDYVLKSNYVKLVRLLKNVKG